MDIKKIIKETDWVIVVICAICSTLSVVSLYAIYSHMAQFTSVSKVLVQRIASVLGLGVAFVISLIDYRVLCEKFYIHSGFCIALMVLTQFIGYAPPGTTNKSWIRLPFGLSLQPSELLKISMVIALAYLFDKNKNNFNEVKTLTKLIAIAAVYLGFVLIQKDGGTAIVYCVIIACMFFVAGVSARLIAIVAGCAVLASPIIWFKVIDDYQRNRVLGLFDPEKFSNIMWQQNQGKISIGSGQLIGKGFFVDNHNATPLVYNDFMFSFLAESIGFVGIVLLLIAIIILWVKILDIAKNSADGMGSYICVGIFGMLMAQTVINIGMNLSLLPVIGVTLPLFSAGGTSVLVTYIAMGLVMSVYRHNPRRLF